MSAAPQFRSFAEFYDYYLTQHGNRACRRLHFVGTNLALCCLIAAAWLRDARLLAAAPLVGYGCAWIGHFVFEKNRPAAWGHPWWSFRGDWRMWKDTWTGRIRF